MFELMVNGRSFAVDVAPDTPVLWVLRDELGMTGTKFGCGAGLCGACTIHMDGEAVRSCSVTVDSVGEAKITTIEGLSADHPHPVQQAWEQADVPQCGYCQPGMIMAVAALIAQSPHPNLEDVENEITNICRCGTYERIRQALHSLLSDGGRQ
jgi:aerobic-type carbon monoxide dehydrogenase small subunit (CoxS/CutS family)